jgi:hypothetical protein
MVKVIKEAATKATADHKLFEQALKTRRKEFGDSLGDLETRVAAFAHYDVIARRAEHAKEVLQLHVDSVLCKQHMTLNDGHTQGTCFIWKFVFTGAGIDG